MKSIISPVYSSATDEQRTYSMRKKKTKTLFGKKKYVIDNKGQNESIFYSERNQKTIKRYRRFLELFLITAKKIENFFNQFLNILYQTDGLQKIWCFNGSRSILFKWRETCTYPASSWKSSRRICATASLTHVIIRG